MTELRPIPGFPGVYAGRDGECYRRLDGYFNQDSPRRYLRLKDEGGRFRSHPEAWYVARAYIGEPPTDCHLADPKNGDFLDTRPSNLEWADHAAKDKFVIDKLHRAKTLRQLKADPADRRHGTLAGYRYGCRCDRCKRMSRPASRITATYKALRELREVEHGDDGGCDGAGAFGRAE